MNLGHTRVKGKQDEKKFFLYYYLIALIRRLRTDKIPYLA
jgi:hypothetical protein